MIFSKQFSFFSAMHTMVAQRSLDGGLMNIANVRKAFSCLEVKPGSHCAILATIWLSETNFENPKRFL